MISAIDHSGLIDEVQSVGLSVLRKHVDFQCSDDVEGAGGRDVVGRLSWLHINLNQIVDFWISTEAADLIVSSQNESFDPFGLVRWIHEAANAN